MQKRHQSVFDRLCFVLGAGEAQNEVVGVPTIAQSAKVGVVGQYRRQLLHLLPHDARLLQLARTGQVTDAMTEALIGSVGLSSYAPGVLWNESRLDERIQGIQIQIGEERANDGALGGATVSRMPGPVLQVPCFEQLSDQ